MGWGWLEDAWDSATDAVGDVAGGIADAVTDAGSAVADAGGSLGGGLGAAIAAVAETVDTATFGLAGHALGAADDYVFDTVDFVTGGAVDVDFDDGRFTVGAGFDGLASVGASIGEHGISADGAVPGASFDVSATVDGLAVGATAGIDFGPLPFVDGHLEIAPNGDIAVAGQIQGTLPTPVGILSGSASGAFAANEEGWAVSVDADGTLYLPSGTTVRGGVEVEHAETDDGSHTSVSVEGSVSVPGVGSAGGAVGYERLEVGDDVVEAFHVEAEASGFGASVRAEADRVSVEVDGVEHTDWSADVDVDLPADLLGEAPAEAALDPVVAPLPEPAAAPDDVDTAIDVADEVTTSVDDLFSDL